MTAHSSTTSPMGSAALPTPLFPSDSLPNIRVLFALFLTRTDPTAPPLDMPPQIAVVLDTNAVLQTLIFLAKPKRDPAARSDLAELIDSQTVLAFVPRPLLLEVERNLPRRAEAEGLSLEVLRSAWSTLLAKIHVEDVDVPEPLPDEFSRHSADAPFILLQRKLGAVAIITSDKDIEAMGGRVMKPAELRALREHSRGAAEAGGISIIGAVGITASGAAVYGAFKVSLSAIRKFGRILAVGALIVGIPVAIALAVSPKLRSQFSDFMRMITSALSEHWSKVGPYVLLLAERYSESSTKSATNLEVFSEQVPDHRRARLVDLAYLVCATSVEPLAVGQIATRVLPLGYLPRARSIERRHVYLERSLRKDSRFAEAAGKWSKRPPVMAPEGSETSPTAA